MFLLLDPLCIVHRYSYHTSKYNRQPILLLFWSLSSSQNIEDIMGACRNSQQLFYYAESTCMNL